jgi:cell division protein FtsI/penicillin-binding protein 2
VNFFAELFTNLHKTLFRDPHSEGDIISTIDPEAQHALEQTLTDVIAKWHNDKAGGIIIDPKTGDIIAMAGFPDFDPGAYSSVKNISSFQNPNVEDVYELGSIVKALTLAAGMDAGVINEQTTYNDTGCMNLNTEHICNFDKTARGITTMQTIFDKSLNMGATFVMQRLGKEKFRDYFVKFGLTEKTGVDMPGEVSNIMNNLKSTREVEYATASFGQGIALTPVSAARAFSALANDGKTVSPRVVKAIRFPDGFTQEIKRPEPVQVLKPETSATITRMLVQTVDTNLLGGTLKLEHYAVAAKTGTAQMAREDGRGYYADQYLHSMFGYYPAYNPRFLVVLYGINPKNVSYSSQTMAVPFMDLAKFLLTYYDVAPDR